MRRRKRDKPNLCVTNPSVSRSQAMLGNGRSQTIAGAPTAVAAVCRTNKDYVCEKLLHPNIMIYDTCTEETRV